MEQEKQAKKKNILKMTKHLEEVGKDSYKELEDQDTQLKKTKKDVKEIGEHVTKIDANLNEIEYNRKSSNRFKNCICLLCCCTNCSTNLNKSNKQFNEIQLDSNAKALNDSIKEDHLTPERIEKEWCMRYDPEDRWIKQVELGLDYLLQLAEQMKKSCDEQNELAEQIYLDVKSTQNRFKNSRQKMKAIQEK